VPVAHETILVVDDEAAIVQVIRERLEQEGFAVRAATSGEEALTAAEEHAPALLILDLVLPGMDGLEVLRHLRQGGRDVSVIILTARDDDVDVVVGLDLFVVEASLIGLLGGVMGAIAGWLLGKGLNWLILEILEWQDVPIRGPFFVVAWWLVVAALAFAMLVGLLAGIYPAARAARLAPLDALLYE
jgi:CheY-like chemotaxis protein